MICNIYNTRWGSWQAVTSVVSLSTLTTIYASLIIPGFVIYIVIIYDDSQSSSSIMIYINKLSLSTLTIICAFLTIPWFVILFMMVHNHKLLRSTLTSTLLANLCFLNDVLLRHDQWAIIFSSVIKSPTSPSPSSSTPSKC